MASVEKPVFIDTGSGISRGKTAILFELATPEPTAKHEAAHTVAAILTGSHVELTSIEPGPGYWGITMMDRFNGVAAMAAHALGYSGTDYDVAVVRARGCDPSFLAQAARSLLADYKDVIYFVAARIQAKGTISGYEAKTIMEYASRPRGTVRLHPYLQPIHPR